VISWTVARSGAGRAPAAQAEPGARSSRPNPPWPLRALRAAAALLGLAVIGGYLATALARLNYPFSLEILETNSLVEVHRILAGQSLYAPPTVSYVPDGYPPLYFGVSAAASSVLGQSYLPLRLVSLVSSLACFAVLARLVQRETRSAAAGIAAAGVLAATYFATGAWFDVARVDSLFLALSVAGLYAARWMRGTGGAIAAGLLLAAAFGTKQTALAEGVAVLGAVAAGPRRRLAVPLALTYGAALGASTLVLGLASHGWYVYYVFEQMGQHALSAASAGQFWTAELLPTLGIAICAVVLGLRRTPLILLAGCAALAVESFAARAQTGSNLNDLLPAYLAVALLTGLALGGLPGLPGGGTDRLARARFPRWRPGRAGRWASAAAAGLVVVQLAMLASSFRPAGRAIPPDADRAAGARLLAGVRALGGTVAIPADPGLAVMAGLPEVEDQVAAADILRASDPAPKAIFTGSVARAVAARRFTVILTQLGRDLRGFPADLPPDYLRCPQMPPVGLPPAPFRPGVGEWTVSVWLPADRERSCAAVIRTLDGQVTASPATRPGVPGRSGGSR
jgi:hypothetical protein